MVGRVAVDMRLWTSPVSPSNSTDFFFEIPFILRYVDTTKRVDAFLIRLQSPTSSSDEFTLVQSTRRYTGALLSSLSKIVRRQSSMASLTAVMNKITIKGTDDNPGLLLPKMENIWTKSQLRRFQR